jgi:hypothetical protein
LPYEAIPLIVGESEAIKGGFGTLRERVIKIPNHESGESCESGRDNELTEGRLEKPKKGEGGRKSPK